MVGPGEDPQRPAPERGERPPPVDAATAKTAEAQRLIEETRASARPERQVPAGLDTGAELAGGTRALNELLSRSPFFDYFCNVAERSSSDKSLETRVSLAHAAHSKLFRFCVIADMILRSLVALILLLVIVAVLYKTLSPLPGLPSPGGSTTSTSSTPAK